MKKKWLIRVIAAVMVFNLSSIEVIAISEEKSNVEYNSIELQEENNVIEGSQENNGQEDKNNKEENNLEESDDRLDLTDESFKKEGEVTDEEIVEENIEKEEMINKYDSSGGYDIGINNIEKASDLSILSETKITKEIAKEWARENKATQRFIDNADLYWKYYKDHGNVNPAIAYAQAAKETGFGRFGGILDESYNNPCGMKTSSGGEDNDPSAHQRFNSWDDGIRAHLDHLALYAGANSYPRTNTYDPRHFSSITGTAKTVSSLGGKWAPSNTYGTEILSLYYKMEEKVVDSTSEGSWSYINGSWYYYNSDGSMHKGWLLLEDWYYLREDGTMAQGREVVDGIEYHFNDSGRIQRNWQFVNGAWRYFIDGQMQRGWLLLEDWYYLKSDGAIAQGREVVDGIEYYFNDSGRMQRGWNFIDGYWKYFNDGKKHIGWLNDNGSKYYMDSYGNMVTGWRTINNDRYFFYASGIMAKDTIIEGNKIGPDGKVQYTAKKPNIIDLGLEFDFGVEGPLPNVPDKLVLHHAAGNATAASVHNFHRFTNGWAGIGYHFYIHKDGKIYKGREENWRGAHAAEVGPSDGNLDNDTNATSLGIAVMGDYYKETMPKAQEDAVVELGKYLVSKYGMKQIFRHGDPGIGQTLCPGKNYPFERIKARILNKQIFVYKQD